MPLRRTGAFSWLRLFVLLRSVFRELLLLRFVLRIFFGSRLVLRLRLLILRLLILLLLLVLRLLILIFAAGAALRLRLLLLVLLILTAAALLLIFFRLLLRRLRRWSRFFLGMLLEPLDLLLHFLQIRLGSLVVWIQSERRFIMRPCVGQIF